MKRRKKGHAGDHENTERWLLTYSDMITLLMAFFIMMYSMSVLNLERFHEVAFSIRSGFGGVLQGQGKHLMNRPAVSLLPHAGSVEEDSHKMMNTKQVAEQMSSQIRAYANKSGLSEKVKVFQDQRGLVIRIASDGLLFARGSSELTSVASGILTVVSKQLRLVSNDIVIEGHTCSLPISTPTFPSNWELSAARSSRVVRYLASVHGIDPRRMSAVGYADTRPCAPNDTEEHRVNNRRVDIVLLNTSRAPEKTVEKVAGVDIYPYFQDVTPKIQKVWDRDPHKQDNP